MKITDTLPLPLNASSRIGKPTNIYLGPKLKMRAAYVARDRYGWSLSRLCRELLQREVVLPRGLVHAEVLKSKRRNGSRP